MRAFVRKHVPKWLLSLYHLALALVASYVYGRPARKMIVIGITGTKGKTTTAYFLARILERAGFRVGLTGTAVFKIAGREWLNATKMTMLGRFALQRMLRDMARAGCTYAIVETSSEGLAQSRHAGIDYDIAVFTNLTPEHIESHGGFENYKKAKGKLFASLASSARKKLGNGKKIIIANLDDENAEYFLNFWADEKWGYSAQIPNSKFQIPSSRYFRAEDSKFLEENSNFIVNSEKVELKLVGRANVMNALAAITAASACGVPVSVSAKALAEIAAVPGRMEFIDEGQPFKIIVDYAHEPASTKELYNTVKNIPHGRIIHVFGSTGGGRDISRRRVLGELAGENTDIVIVTTDDPYDDDPGEIAEAVAYGARIKDKKEGESLFIILDRREAIRKAIGLARPGDIVLVTGKGSEQVMVLADGRKVPWDDRRITREEILHKLT